MKLEKKENNNLLREISNEGGGGVTIITIGTSNHPRQHKPSPARKPSMDEPEVELLSISSEDDDVERESDVRERGRAKKEDDGGGTLDGEEPDCWKRVNEAELARRVRDMRESRTAPVVQKLEDKVSEPGKKVVLTSLQSLPRVMECIDPLKLGIIDNKTLRLISESLGSPSKAEKVDNTLGEKLIYFSDHFDPKLFLSRIHQDTSAADLEAGALGLKSDLKGRNLQRKQLVKDNFDCFVSCKTTIDDIESKLKRIEEDPEGSGTTHVFNCMKSVTSRANLAFEPLFERQAQAEKIRSVQGMLQRFRTLFNLPSIIRNSISKGEYDLAVREYKKAKSIALPSHVNILKRVLEEVEKVMLEFKGTLYKTMEDTKIDFTSLENTVRLLLELEPESDPVWHYINVQNHRIHGLLEKCTYDHEARVETLRNETRERAISDAKWQQIQQNVVPYSDAASSTESNEVQVDLQSVEFPSEEIDALKGRYIKIITGVLVHHIPAFWKTALSVFSGKFAKEKVTEARFSTHSLEEVAGMIRKGVNNTFCDFDESCILRPFMSNAIQEVSKACQAFEAKDSVPPQFGKVQAEITKIYIQRLCSWMRASTERISKEETWIPVSILERNKSPYAISYLPLAFRSVIVSGMEQINLKQNSSSHSLVVVQASPELYVVASKSSFSVGLSSVLVFTNDLQTRSSGSPFIGCCTDISMFLGTSVSGFQDDCLSKVKLPNQKIEEMLISVRLAFLNCFLDFAAHLDQIGADLSTREDWKNGYSDDQQEVTSANTYGSVVDPHRRDLQDLIMSFSGLGEKVLEHYTFSKANLIRTAATSYLLDSGIQWGSAPQVIEEDDYLKYEMQLLSSCILFRPCRATQPRLIKLYKETVLEIALESVSESVETTPGHNRRPTRGSEDTASDDRQGSSVSADELLVLTKQYSSELLQTEMERTSVNTACFAESVPVEPTPPLLPKASYRGPMDSPSRNYRGKQSSGSPIHALPRRR
ncbi:LOW QUALITY PROTEIN: hypothetical protein HID58_006084 [Brassica napus]|uniref:Exocyst complex component SEC5 n=1 Tax=Brassica napus TaxID=3708 RepID=A0ABQ8EAD6_BRANA|nr:LOW QUALITY PROTEIN: hypothetical protein HID58_006084 [Brassica napus]